MSHVTLVRDPTQRPPGRLVAGRYRLQARLGEGGMAQVWRAIRVDVGTDVAVKLLRADRAGSDEAVARFEREAHAAARLSHPGCVSVIDFGKDGDELYLVLELVRGKNLAQRLADGPLAPARAAEIIDGLLGALEHAHASGVVHRDLKPQNLMLLADGGIKLLDFGVARLLDVEVDPGARHATAAGVVVGTPQYLSPEQALGEPGDARADVYAAGVLFWQMLVGRPPFAGATQREVLAAQIGHMPPAPSALVPDAGIPPQLDAVVMRALAKPLAERWPSATAMRRALVKACHEAGLTARLELPANPEAWNEPGAGAPPEERTGFLTTWRSWPVWLRGALAAAVLAVLALGVSLALGGDGEAAPAGGPVMSAEPAELARVRAALARGDLAAAEAEAKVLVAANPDDPRAFVLLGHALFAGRDKKRGLAAYREVVRLDRDAADPELLANLRATFADKNVGEEAFLVAERLGVAALPAIDDLARATKDARLRARAVRARAAIVEATVAEKR